jgi:hypothetical protein
MFRPGRGRAGRPHRPQRQAQRAEVGPLQSQLDHHDVAGDAHPVQLAVHVRERSRVDLHRLGQLVRPAVGDTDRLVGKRAVLGEGCNRSLEVLVLGDLVGLPDDLVVVLCHLVLLSRAIGTGSD